MSKLPGTDDHDSRAAHGEVTGVFKSDDMPVQRLNSGTNSAVSDVAVDRGADDFRPNQPIGTAPELIPITQGLASEEEPHTAVSAANTLETLEVSVAKVDELVKSVEQRQSQIEEAHQKAEAMLAELNRIAEVMTFSDTLRERINATVIRTRRLRSENGK